MSLTAGYHHDVPMGSYVDDSICAEPSLSTGIAQALIERTARHAWQEHAKLGGGSDEPTGRSDIGQAVHSLSLGGAPTVYVSANDWRTKAAQEARDAARAEGRIPLLASHERDVETAAANAKAAIARFGGGKPEVTMLWRDGLVWCRGRADWLTDDGAYDLDIKTCENADPAAWIRSTLVQGGYDVQAALRTVGHETLTKRTRDVLFVLVEIKPPYAVSVVGLAPAFVELGRRKVAHAVKLWGECLRANKWPAYDQRIHYAEPPGWAEFGFEERLIAKEVA